VVNGRDIEFNQVEAMTIMQRSRALTNFGRPGGGEQFQLLERLPSVNFGARIPFQAPARRSFTF
jgi:hypothetical protein